MSGEHTPGPWVWRGKDGGLYQEGTSHRFGEAVMVPSYEYDRGIDTVVSEADMALIAAAPDLLEALLKIVAEDDTGPMMFEPREFGPSQALGGSEGRFAEIARAAIAKAKGESS